jgi:pyruvate,water dikinase
VTPLDIEWAIDGITNELFIVQARPETVVSKSNKDIIREYNLIKDEKYKQSTVLVEGVAVGKKMSSGRVRKLFSLDNREKLSQNDFFCAGDILVTDMTDPDWEPIMKISGGIITNRGGRTCHASIVARELGVPAIVGTINCTEVLKNGMDVTLVNDGDIGKVYSGMLTIKTNEINIKTLPKIGTKLMFNIASPEIAFNYHNYPVHGVGLVRQEFMFNNYIKVHPMALLQHKKLNDPELTKEIQKLIEGYDDEEDYFLKKLSYGLARIGAAFKDHDVIVRFSDFKSNEYRNLLGGKYFEPNEENPMIGWRGASRYYSPQYKKAFGMECRAIKYIRDEMGLTNIVVMIPFCRTVKECIQVQETMAEYGLKRGQNGLRVFLMCEIPSNVIMAEEFAKHIDGFSIGSNDLTQLTLGLDRDSELVQYLYDERDDAVKEMLRMVIRTCKRTGTKIGICGQGPSDYPDFAKFLMEEGIDTISITPDSLLHTINVLA